MAGIIIAQTQQYVNSSTINEKNQAQKYLVHS